MILHPPESIERYTRLGLWGERTLLDALAANVAAHPQRPAIADPPNRAALTGNPPRTLDYAEFGAAVEGLAIGLLRLGLRKDEIVIAQLPNVWELMALYFAVARAGGVLSPIPMQWRQTELVHVASTTAARWYVGVPEFKGHGHLEMARRIGLSTLALGELGALADSAAALAALEPAAPEAALEAVRPGANDIFSLCWSSGTEALAKGCPMSHNTWLSQMRLLPAATPIADGDRILTPAPMVNMTGGVAWLAWLHSAGTLLLHHPLEVELLLSQLIEGGVRFAMLVPAILNMILKLPQVDRLDLSHIRSIATGSAAPSHWSVTEFKRRWGIDILHLWGQTEGTGLVGGPVDVPDQSKRADHFPWWGRSGLAWPSGLAGIEVKLLDAAERECQAPGETGELVYRGPNVFAGYYISGCCRRPDPHEGSFTEDGFFRTGDLFVIRDARHLGFFDRKKDIIIRGGFKISAAEVENLLLGHPQVAEVAALAMPDEILGEKVCVFVVPKRAEDPPTLAGLVEHLRAVGVAAYKLPERLELIAALPRNPVGKILKAQLRERLAA